MFLFFFYFSFGKLYFILYPTCRYADYREPPTSVHPYYLSSTFYVILACRLGFVVVFEVSFSSNNFIYFSFQFHFVAKKKNEHQHF